jgi:uncharacterized protein (UPF0335 family)
MSDDVFREAKETAVMPENSIEGRAEPFLKRVEGVLDDLASLKGKYMADAKALRGDIKEIYKDAKAEDVPVRALKGLVKYRELERKQNALADELEDEDADAFETLVEALGAFGDTPLGQAALDLAGGDEEGEGDQRPRFKQTEDEAPKTKRARKPRSPAAEHAQALGGESTEETEALGEIEQAGIGGVASSFTVQP